MSAKIDLHAEIRSDIGKRASRRLRRTDKVLANVYGAHKEATPVMLEHHKVNKALENEAFFSSILTLTIDGKAEKVVAKAIQRHPFKPRVMHIDFFRINPKEKLTMNIPLHFIGEDKAPGVVEGGVFSHLLTDVEVRCLPADLPEYIEVDLSNMKLDDYVYLTDIKLPSGVELVAFTHGDVEEHNAPVANLHMPHIIEIPEEVVAISPEVPSTEVAAEPAEGAAAEEGKKEEGKKA